MNEGKTTYVHEHNVITKEEYRAHAKETLNIIKETLSQSLGYYGSTSILEDNIMGNTVTKDGYTILNQIRFGPSDTISNTLLKMIKNISRSLVMEVGDGSTSAVVSSEALFNKLISDEKFLSKYKDIPSKVIIDTLKVIEGKVKESLREKAEPITEDNFERLKDIASISNNNDEESGNIIYEIYKHIGKEGFVVLEKGYGEEDSYEVANGIETSFGFSDDVFSNKANGFEGEYKDPKIIVVNGQLDHNDIEWASRFMGSFYSKSPSTPLIFVSTGYDREFLNFLKINFQENNRKAGVQMAATILSPSKEEVLYDLATYIGAKVIDKSDDATYDMEIDPFLKNNMVEITRFLNEDLGTCDSVYMNMNFTRFIEGAGDPEKIQERVDQIEKEIKYIEQTQSEHKDIAPSVHPLERRIGNLKAQIAKLYVTGNSDTEVDTRKYLFEDAIYASKSALQHGYIPGGNMGVSRVIDELLETEYDEVESDDKYKALEKDLALLVKDSFLNVYRTVLSNANYDLGEAENIITVCLRDGLLFNIKEEQYDSIDETPVINSVMTDIRIMESVFSIIGLLVTSNQYIQKMPRSTTEI